MGERPGQFVRLMPGRIRRAGQHRHRLPGAVRRLWRRSGRRAVRHWRAGRGRVPQRQGARRSTGRRLRGPGASSRSSPSADIGSSASTA